MANVKLGPQSKTTEPEGRYAPLVDCYVKVFLPNLVVVGKLIDTNYETTKLQPYLARLGTDLSDEAQIVEDNPATISTEAIHAVWPLNIGREYLEELVNDAKERTKREKYLREKDLREKGYFDKQDKKE